MPYSDYPTSEEKRIPYKLIAIIGGGVVIAVVIIGVVIRMVKSRTEEGVVINQSTGDLLSECDQAQNKEACQRTLVEQASQLSGDAEICKQLSGDASDQCIWTIARNTANPAVCESIASDEIKMRCRDSALFAKAKSDSDQSLCDKITSEEKKNSCLALFAPAVTSENCVSLGKSSAYCEMISVSEEAMAKQDREFCNKLGDEERVFTCIDLVSTDDPDFDNLASSLEIYYKSDPRNPDTDGDGFKDGDEVFAGYNPNGSGKLE